MARPKHPRPTDAELEILNVLWRRGPSTVREVHDEISKARATGYTSVLKVMQIMAGKGLVEREERQRLHVYRAAAAEEETQGALVRDLLERAFNGSAAKLVMHALSSERASAEDRALIRKLLKDYEEKQK
jgi:BlaI family transcriptional regulator, penicillinase repressor